MARAPVEPDEKAFALRGSRIRGRRRRMVLAVGCVAVLSAAVLWWKRDDDDVDWTTSDSPPPEALSTELPARPSELLWQDDSGASEVQIVDDYVVQELSYGVEVRDLPTGRVRWHYFAPDGPPLETDVTGRRVVVSKVNFGSAGDPPPPPVVELDLSSGRRVEDAGASDATGSGGGRSAPIIRAERFRVHAWDADTGERVWRSSGFPSGCEVAHVRYRDPIKVAEGVVAVALDCGDHHEIGLLDAATGRARWHRPLAAPGVLLDTDADGVLVIVDTPGRPTVEVLDGVDGERVVGKVIDGHLETAAGEFVDRGWCAVTDLQLACYGEGGEALVEPTDVLMSPSGAG